MRGENCKYPLNNTFTTFCNKTIILSKQFFISYKYLVFKFRTYTTIKNLEYLTSVIHNLKLEMSNYYTMRHETVALTIWCVVSFQTHI